MLRKRKIIVTKNIILTIYHLFSSLIHEKNNFESQDIVTQLLNEENLIVHEM